MSFTVPACRRLKVPRLVQKRWVTNWKTFHDEENIPPFSNRVDPSTRVQPDEQWRKDRVVTEAFQLNEPLPSFIVASPHADVFKSSLAWSHTLFSSFCKPCTRRLVLRCYSGVDIIRLMEKENAIQVFPLCPQYPSRSLTSNVTRRTLFEQHWSRSHYYEVIWYRRQNLWSETRSKTKNWCGFVRNDPLQAWSDIVYSRVYVYQSVSRNRGMPFKIQKEYCR